MHLLSLLEAKINQISFAVSSNIVIFLILLAIAIRITISVIVRSRRISWNCTAVRTRFTCHILRDVIIGISYTLGDLTTCILSSTIITLSTAVIITSTLLLKK